MQFINKKDITVDIEVSDFYIPTIDIDKQEIKQLIQKISDNEQLLTDINILNQNLESINVQEYSYVHFGTKLQFSELSRGEKVFLVSLAAKYTGEIIYLQYDILQLTKTSMRKYYSLFKDCNNINIIYEDEQVKECLVYEMRGEIV